MPELGFYPLRVVHIVPAISQMGLWRHLEAAAQLPNELFQNSCLEIFDLGADYSAGPLEMKVINLGVELSQYRDVDVVTGLVESACRDLHPSLIHTYHLFSDVYAARAAHRLGVGVVRTVAGVTQASWTNPFLRSHARTGWDAADILEQLEVEPFVRRTLAVSKATKQMLCGYGFDADKVSVSYLGTPLDVPPHVLPASHGSAMAAITIGFPHRLEPSKIGPALLPALARVVGEGVAVKLILVRTGNLFDYLHSQLLEIGVQVVAVSVTPDLWSALPPLDCVILNSISEGLPLVLLEAMARRVPVIASRAGGVEEAVVDGFSGHIFEYDDAERLAQLIFSIVRQPRKARLLGEAGCEFVRSHFGRRQHLLDLEACYRAVVLG